MEKAREHVINLEMIFIDFKQAFDSIIRKKRIKAMIALEIQRKVIKLVKMTLEGTNARVTIKEGETEELQ